MKQEAFVYVCAIWKMAHYSHGRINRNKMPRFVLVPSFRNRKKIYKRIRKLLLLGFDAITRLNVIGKKRHVCNDKYIE